MRDWIFGTLVMLFVGTSFGLSPTKAQEAEVPRDLVVMINAQSPNGQSVQGAGVIVGYGNDGLAFIATARHVVHSPFVNLGIEVRHISAPDSPIPASLVKFDFNKDLDLAVISAALPARRASMRVGSLLKAPEVGDNVKLIGQTGGVPWAESPTSEKVGISKPGRIAVQSSYGGPGLSGGAALDDSGRVFGIALTDDGFIVTVLPISEIAKELAQHYIPFMIEEGKKRINPLDVVDEKERLIVALSSGQFEQLASFQNNKKTALLTESILAEDKTVRNLFFLRAKQDEALNWFRELIRSGLNPNFIARSPDGRGALYYALANNNIDLAIVMLEEGASPHVYQALWGNETSAVSLLNPLDWISRLSASQEEKRKLVLAMVDAGLAALVRSPKGDYAFKDREFEKNLKLLEYVGVPLEKVDALLRHNPRCELFSDEMGVDWCVEVEKVPNYIEDISGGGDNLTKGFLIGKFIGIYNGNMYFYAIGAHGEWNGNPASLAIVSQGRDSVTLYRYSGNAAGLGHCSRLRDRAAGREVGDFKDSDRNASCWRRATLSRTFGEPGYDYYWDQSYYCRNGSVDYATIEAVRSGGTAWNDVSEEVRMAGRVPC
ncbi:MAG: trypsin-like peptidase domain-containing protein [Rhizobiaceae bacterium]|nr:trypsin-like peptidase domain-containing protein [Rhizobiaceae bacterium]